MPTGDTFSMWVAEMAPANASSGEGGSCGLTTWGRGRESYSILPEDPLSARQECHWSMETSRGNWVTRTETYSSMRATATHFHITGRLEAYEGKKQILVRHWDKKVKRRLL